MHIVLISHHSPPHLGGIGIVATELMKRLSSRGHHTTLITSDADVAAGTYRRGKKTHIAVRSTNPLENYDIPYPFFDPIELRRVLRAVLSTADVVHSHGMLFMSTAMATTMARRRGIPVILTEHVGRIPYGSTVKDGLQDIAIETLGRYCCQQSSAVTYLNQRVAHEIASLLPSGAETTKIPNGVDTELFRPANPERKWALRRRWGFKRPTALFVGRFAQRKGIDLLLGAANGAFDLVFCGDGARPVQQENVRVVGPLAHEVLPELYQAADVVVLPSVGEGFPLVVQEAMACGLPVVVTDSPEYREYLTDEVAVFTRREPSAIRESIMSVLGSPGRGLRMGHAARAWALARFDWEQTVDQYLDLYSRHVTNGHGNGRV